jgi:uncharacterized protein YegL
MTDSFNQIPFADAEFAENPEPRCPCILLLDTSGSMNGRPVAELNNGLAAFRRELLADSMATKRVEIALITFGPVKVLSPFQAPDVFEPPTLTASGNTPMGQAIEEAVRMLDVRKVAYRQNGVSYYRPWIFLITDGAPTDDWTNAAAMIREGEDRKSFMFFTVGVENADINVLRRISVREPLRLSGLRFRDLFSWLSNSLSSVSRTNVGDPMPLQNPTAPGGWAVLD